MPVVGKTGKRPKRKRKLKSGPKRPVQPVVVTYASGETVTKSAKAFRKPPKKKSRKAPDYTTYMQSAEWREVRARALHRDGRCCTGCGSKTRLDVHHLTYKRFGHEDLDDLVTLCRGCHEAAHGRRFDPVR